MVHVAVVNDDTAFLELMQSVIAEEGWDTSIIREGDRAYEEIKERQPDVVVLDLRLEAPDTGWRVLEMIKLDKATTHIPIIVCSAAIDDLRLREDWLAQHGVDTLLKPFDIDDLYTRIRTALSDSETVNE